MILRLHSAFPVQISVFQVMGISLPSHFSHGIPKQCVPLWGNKVPSSKLPGMGGGWIVESGEAMADLLF